MLGTLASYSMNWSDAPPRSPNLNGADVSQKKRKLWQKQWPVRAKPTLPEIRPIASRLSRRHNARSAIRSGNAA
jgi:hypothetical protein